MKKITQISRTYILIACLFFGAISYAQVGIGTNDPRTALDTNGALSLREGTALALSNGNNNNVSLGAAPYSLYRITGPTAAFNLSGIVPATSSDGQIVTLINTTPQVMTLRHNVTSAAINRFFCPGAKDYVLTGQYSTVTLQYSATQLRWVIINYADARYGDNIQYSIGTSDIQTNSTTFTTMANMSITFTPKHAVVFVNFGAAGYMNTSATGAYVDFRLQNGGTTVAGTTSLATDYDSDFFSGSTVNTSWNAHFTMYPVTVTPGVPTTIRVQWSRDGTGPAQAYCNPTLLPDSCHRSLTILD